MFADIAAVAVGESTENALLWKKANWTSIKGTSFKITFESHLQISHWHLQKNSIELEEMQFYSYYSLNYFNRLVFWVGMCIELVSFDKKYLKSILQIRLRANVLSIWLNFQYLQFEFHWHDDMNMDIFCWFSRSMTNEMKWIIKIFYRDNHLKIFGEFERKSMLGESRAKQKKKKKMENSIFHITRASEIINISIYERTRSKRFLPIFSNIWLISPFEWL